MLTKQPERNACFKGILRAMQKLDVKAYLALRLLPGFDFAAWCRILRRYGLGISPSKIPDVLIITAVSTVVSVLKLIENLLFGARIRATQVHDAPVFILGHWRSGTTLLHELLCLDERFTFPTSFSCVAPHNFLLADRLFMPLIKRFFPSQRLQDNMALGPDTPQEDEFALSYMGAVSPYTTHFLIRHLGRYADFYELEKVPAASRRHWENSLVQFLKKVTFRQDRPVVLKSPTHTFRAAILLRLFPKARFVYLVRNPFDVFPSAIHTWNIFARYASLRAPDAAELEEYVLDVFNRMHLKFESDRHLIPPGQLHCIRYEDLAAAPEAEMEKLYKALSLDCFEQVRPLVQAYAAKNAGYKKNKFSLSPETRERIARRWGPFISQYGYADRAEESGSISPPCGHAACSTAESNQHDYERLP